MVGNLFLQCVDANIFFIKEILLILINGDTKHFVILFKVAEKGQLIIKESVHHSMRTQTSDLNSGNHFQG